MTKPLWFAAGVLLASAAHAAAVGFSDDPVVRQVEIMLNTAPGQMIPADWRFPTLRLRYLGTRSAGGGDYDVRVHRYPADGGSGAESRSPW
jgi:hypothetical protein